MKSRFFVTVLMLTFSQMAAAECPQLTGTYSCSSQTGNAIRIELFNLDRSTYQLEDQIVIRASELGVKTVSTGNSYKMTTLAICRNQVLDLETEFSNPKDGKFLSFEQRSYVRQSSGDIDVLVTWNDNDDLESSLIKCQKLAK